MPILIIGRPGNLTTDFGAPDALFPDDWELLSLDEIERYQAIISACWNAFNRAIEAAAGRELRKGPRGGGRDLNRMIRHVIEAEESYLRALGVNPFADKETSEQEKIIHLRKTALRSVSAAKSNGSVLVVENAGQPVSSRAGWLGTCLIMPGKSKTD